MAWRSSGSNNTEMVDKLKRFGVITSDHIEDGFRMVDRKFFVPRGNESMAHSDQPLKEGNVHISAPHIYGSAIEALDLTPNSSISFLNVGSGTGYISCIAAEILGPNSLNYGVELHEDVIEHCKASITKWKANTVEERDTISVIHFLDATADIQIIKGNGLNILKTKGESVVGFDRIYIGAAVDKDDLANITKLLSPGGILVGPVDDELVKVVRVGNISLEMEGDITMGAEGEESSLSGLNEEFTSQILSGVRFAPLVMRPSMDTVIPANVWNPSIQHGYPSEFKHASMQLLMCSNSKLVQPPPPVPKQEELFNAAALLPKSIWLEILSYTHRKWFESEQNETDYLRRRLKEEKAKAAKAEMAHREAEERCLSAERERAVYRLLARRWQSRLNVLLSQQDRQEEIARQEELSDLMDLAGGAMDNDNVVARHGLRSMLQHLSDNAHNGGDNIDSDEDPDMADEELVVDDMEEDDTRENHDHSGEDDNLSEFLEDDNVSESDDLASVAEEDSVENDSVIMEDVDNTIAKERRAVDQPRSVSMSSDDL